MLPPELLRPIVWYIFAEKDRRSLHALSLTSSVLGAEGERLLYRNITLANEALHHKFLTTVVGSRRKALLVHSYSQRGPDFAGKQRLWNLLSQALKNMHNLTHLSFRPTFFPAGPNQIQEWGFQLHSLDCPGMLDVTQVFSDFLSGQPKLIRLGLEWASSISAPMASSVCPALDMLSGNRAIIERFLPARQITSLAWMPFQDDSTPIDHLAPSLNYLRVLSFGGLTSRPSLSLFVIHLQSLEVLKLVDVEDEELELFQDIPKLKILILLSAFHRRDYSKIPPIDWAPVAENAFLTCGALEYMDISTHRKNYERWVPGVGYGEPTLQPYQAIHSWWQVQIPDTRF